MLRSKAVWTAVPLILACQDLREQKPGKSESDASAQTDESRERDDSRPAGRAAVAGEGSMRGQAGEGGKWATPVAGGRSQNSAAGSGGRDVGQSVDDAAAEFPFSPSNVPAGIDLSAADEMVFNNAACESNPKIDTSTGEIYGCDRMPKQVRYSYKEITQSDDSLGTLSAALFVTGRFVVEQGIRLTVVGNRPLIVVAQRDVLISGELDAAAHFDDARGGGFGVPDEGQNGLGPGGGGKLQARSGGGGGGFCGRGGQGGASEAGLKSDGGATYGTPENVPLVGGSSGARVMFSGSGGGGAVQLSAGTLVEVSKLGAIHVGGGGSGPTNAGGGAGGAILLEAPEVRVLGRLAANGGGGSTVNVASADSGSDNKPALGAIEGDRRGGNGAAGDTIDGEAGSSHDDSGSGGGGGAGRIRINAREASPDLKGAIISPSANTPCFSVGALAAD